MAETRSGKSSAVGATKRLAVSRQPRKVSARRDLQRYVLRLYVTGMTRTSGLAIERIRAICEEHLNGRYQLEVVDIYQLPALARDEQIVATPTLVRVLPPPLRRFIGNLSRVDTVLFGLGLREKE